MKIRYGIAETIGLRREMEDTHSIRDEEESGFFCAEVYDGHSGSLAAAIARDVLTTYFLRRLREGGSTGGNGFMAEALREAYLATDRQVADRGTESGAAAATLYLHKKGFLAANAGDVRIVLKDGGHAKALTTDHKPDLPEEMARIEALGGSVISLDVPRVEGFLAMSRALGDTPLKPFVTPEPRIVEGVLGRKDDLAIIASDGLWDVLTSDQAVALAHRAGEPEEAARVLRAAATERGSADNITVIVLDLKAYAAESRYHRLHVTRILDRAAETT
jgi:protein phosphatase 1L